MNITHTTMEVFNRESGNYSRQRNHQMRLTDADTKTCARVKYSPPSIFLNRVQATNRPLISFGSY